MEISKIIQAKFKSEQQKAIVNLRFTANFIGHHHNMYMSRFDLSMAQFNILRILRGAKTAITVNACKERMVEKSPNTTRLMDKLIEKGLIDRVRCDSDRRVVYVSIADKGLELLTEIDKDMDDELKFAENLTDEEATQLSDLLDKLRGDFNPKDCPNSGCE